MRAGKRRCEFRRVNRTPLRTASYVSLGFAMRVKGVSSPRTSDRSSSRRIHSLDDARHQVRSWHRTMIARGSHFRLDPSTRRARVDDPSARARGALGVRRIAALRYCGKIATGVHASGPLAIMSRGVVTIPSARPRESCAGVCCRNRRRYYFTMRNRRSSLPSRGRLRLALFLRCSRGAAETFGPAQKQIDHTRHDDVERRLAGLCPCHQRCENVE